MTPTPRSPRSWPSAALIGAAGVILPLALAFGVWRFIETRRLAANTAALFPDASFSPALAWTAAAQGFLGFALISGVFGLPVAFSLTSVMARLERTRPAARTLPVWWAASAIASLPIIILFLLWFGAAGGAVGLGFGVTGATIAWTWRHVRLSTS